MVAKSAGQATFQSYSTESLAVGSIKRASRNEAVAPVGETGTELCAPKTAGRGDVRVRLPHSTGLAPESGCLEQAHQRDHASGAMERKSVDWNPKGQRAVVLTTVRSLLTLAVLLAAYYLLPLDSAFTASTVLALIGGGVVVVMLLVGQVRTIMRATRPGLRALSALATALPLFLLLFAAAYYLLERSTPASFSESLSRTDALYFTVTVFTTVGFGDISPRSEPARLLTMGQMAANFLLIGVAARFLVGAVQEGRRPKDRTATGGGDGSPPHTR
ncbi:potassium channel family protein [Streptomyces sp. NPDC060006]|uniref:potassium channel family protein n=1 Tax=unclassified Streptomyces TaxID=2593676 RepID=UPI003698DC33